jgi:O-antigen biosynthesis protein
MEFTGERFIPKKTGCPGLAQEHWHRYYMAAEYVKDKIVLDIACGAGYGSHFLSNYAKEVVGMDISEESIEYAKTNFLNDNLSFHLGSVTEIPVMDKSADIIASFETIEHIDEPSQHRAMSEFLRILKEDGILFISTPSMDAPDHNPNNDFHIKEFHTQEFINFLEKYFKHVTYVGQNLRTVSSFFSSSSSDSMIYYSNYPDLEKQVYPDKNTERYLVAACSNKEPVRIANSILVDNKNTFIQRFWKNEAKYVNYIQTELKRYEEIIAKLSKKR